jgi:hypothetical protein
MASCIALALVIAVVTAGQRQASSALAATSLDYSRPECPRYGEWTTWFDSLKDPVISHTGLLALPGMLTNVPEFHDCQRFINDTGNKKLYMSLTAIFARDSLREYTARLDSVPDGRQREKQTVQQKDSGSASTNRPVAGRGPLGLPTAPDPFRKYGRPVAVAEVMALDSGYSTLGIKRGFNCLYLYGKAETVSGLEARMIPVGANDTNCLKPLPSGNVGTVLEVRRTRFPKMTVPPVARWDWDGTHLKQYIGIDCGSAAYCDIGPAGFVMSKAHSGLATTPQQVVLAVKGWYDEQRLAYPQTTTSLTQPDVGPIMGTLVPAPNLASHNGKPLQSDFANHWVPVATAFISDSSTKYKKKLNLERGTPESQRGNAVFLCFGNKRTCVVPDTVASESCPTNPEDYTGASGAALQSMPPQNIDPTQRRWWARIVSAVTGKVAVYCVTRREHEKVDIPGVVRWRWAINDETMWVRCLEGCCEVEAGHSDS